MGRSLADMIAQGIADPLIAAGIGEPVFGGLIGEIGDFEGAVLMRVPGDPLAVGTIVALGRH